MAGRYAEALRVLEQQSTDNYTVYSWIFRVVSNAALGKHDEAKTWLTKALKQHPDLTIEGFVSNDTGLNDTERKLWIDMMGQAGFPPCAKPDQLKGIAKPVRLPNCSAMAAP